MTYHYTGFSQSGLLVFGELTVPDGTPLDRVTIKVAHECARRACKAGLIWDPFNLSIAIKRRKKQPKCTP